MSYLNRIGLSTFMTLLFMHSFLINCFAQSNLSIKDPKAYIESSGDTLLLKKEYESSFEKPVILHRGDILKSDCNKIYLINSPRFRFYEKLRFLLSDSLSLGKNDLLSKYENLIFEYRTDYGRLRKNCDSISLSFSKMLSSSDSLLKLAQINLHDSQESLKRSKEALIDAEQRLQDEIEKDFFDKLYIGLGACGIGVLLTLFAL